MNGETPGPDSQEIQPPVETIDSAAEIVQGLRDRIEDPVDLRKFSKEHDVKSGKWGSGATKALEAFHEKYSRWPGQEEEDRQIKEYLTEGSGGKWQEKTLEEYRERFPTGSIDPQKWEETVLLTRDRLRHDRFNRYIDKMGPEDAQIRQELLDLLKPIDERITSILEPKPENTESTPKAELNTEPRVSSATKGKERSDGGPNEDSVLVDDEKRIYGVFDGMGGSDRPAEASAMAAKVIGEDIQGDRRYSSPEEVLRAVYKSLEKSDKEIHEKIGDGETTATVAKIWEHKGQQYLVYGHVGDSRLYLARERETLKQISVDDSMAAEDLKNGRITEEEAIWVDQAESKTDLRKDERLVHLFDNRHLITGALGDGDYSIQSGVIEIKPGDKIVLTSDGIHDNLTKEHIQSIVWNSPDKADTLVMEASVYSKFGHYRSKDDDMSAVVIEISDDRDHFADFPVVEN